MTTSDTAMAIASRNPDEVLEDQVQHSFGVPARLHQTSVWNGRNSDALGLDQHEKASQLLTKPEQYATVLVVDDDTSIALLLEELLESVGYHVLVAHSGRIALALARSERPSLVLTDYMMPGVDGAELVRRLRQSPITNDIPVVMMSSIRPRLAPHAGIAGLRLPEACIIDSVKRGVYLAAVGDVCLPFLEKPFDLDIVLELVRVATMTTAGAATTAAMAATDD